MSKSDFDLIEHLLDQIEFSKKNFGPSITPGDRTEGLFDHIQKELIEIQNDPLDLEEWIDVIILALDGAWRAGYTPEEIVSALCAKHEKNKKREWPDWRTSEPGKAIEHIRTTNE